MQILRIKYSFDNLASGMIDDMTFKNSTIISMVHTYFNGLPIGHSMRQLNTLDNVWYLTCDKANGATGSYILYTHAPDFNAPFYGQCLNGLWTDCGAVALKADLESVVQSFPTDGRIGLDLNTNTKVLAIYKGTTQVGTVKYT